MTQQERERLTEDEPIPLQRRGTSDGFTVPAAWLKTFKNLKREPIIFFAHVEKDQNGVMYIVFKKVKTENGAGVTHP